MHLRHLGSPSGSTEVGKCLIESFSKYSKRIEGVGGGGDTMSDDYHYKHVVIEANGIPVPPLYGSTLGSSVARDYLSRSRDTLNSTKDYQNQNTNLTLSKDAEIKTTTTTVPKPPPAPVHDETWEVITGIPKRKKSIDSGDSLDQQTRHYHTGTKGEEVSLIDSGNETLSNGGKTTTTTAGNSPFKTTLNQQVGDTRPLSPSNSAYLSSRLNHDSSTYETYEHTVITRTRSPSPGAKLIGFGSNLFSEERNTINPITEKIETTTVTRRPSAQLLQEPLTRPQTLYDNPPIEQTTVKTTVKTPAVVKPAPKSQTLPIGTAAPKPKKSGWTLCRSKKSKDDSECLVPLKSRLVGETLPRQKRGKSSPPGVQKSQNNNNSSSIESGAATWLVKANNIPVSERILDPYKSIVPNYRSPQPLTIHGITGDFNIQLKTDVRNQNIVTLEGREGRLYQQGAPFTREFDKDQPLDLSLRFFGDQVFIYYFEEEIARLPAVIKRDNPHAIIDITGFQKVDAVTREGIELKQLLPQPYVNKFNLQAGDVLYFETVAYTDFDLHFLNDNGDKLDRLKIKPGRGTVKHTLKKNTLLTYKYRETHHHNVIKITAKEFGNLYHLVINDVFIGNFIGSPIEKVKGIYLETPKYLLAFQHRPAKTY